ncbi:hypothetical protein BaRGS_00015107 [Batillaria attramentaria]|uniref:RING-type E3 ubiquitin transferase n=1 Tax=Batillaria attramentaria TaxID=370345 RepID=A0ABD0L2A9_9CAEN
MSTSASDDEFWPDSLSFVKDFDGILRCPICFDYMQAPMLLPNCQHNFCSLCIRRYFIHKEQCPVCSSGASSNELRSNQIMDTTIQQYKKMRQPLFELVMNKQCTYDVSSSKSNHSSQTVIARREKPVQPAEMSAKANKDADHSLFVPVKTSPLSANSVVTKQEKRSPRENSLARKCASNALKAMKRSSMALESSSDSDSSDVEIVTEESETSQKLSPFPCQPNSSFLASLSDSPKRKTVQSKLFAHMRRSSDQADVSSGEKGDPNTSSPKGSNLSNGSPVPSTSQGSPAVGGVPSPLLSPHRCAFAKKDKGKSASSPVSSSVGEKVPCPVCGVPVLALAVNRHLDLCLASSEKKAAMRQNERRKPLPKLVYNLMPDKDIRRRLKELGLSTQGDRQTLIKRHHEFTLFHNADCDSVTPRPVSDLLKEFEDAQGLQKKMTSKSANSQSILRFTKDSKKEDIEKAQKSYALQHKAQFKSLIRDARERMKAVKRNQGKQDHSGAQPAGSSQETSDTPESTPEETADTESPASSQGASMELALLESTLEGTAKVGGVVHSRVECDFDDDASRGEQNTVAVETVNTENADRGFGVREPPVSGVGDTEYSCSCVGACNCEHSHMNSHSHADRHSHQDSHSHQNLVTDMNSTVTAGQLITGTVSNSSVGIGEILKSEEGFCNSKVDDGGVQTKDGEKHRREVDGGNVQKRDTAKESGGQMTPASDFREDSSHSNEVMSSRLSEIEYVRVVPQSEIERVAEVSAQITEDASKSFKLPDTKRVSRSKHAGLHQRKHASRAKRQKLDHARSENGSLGAEVPTPVPDTESASSDSSEVCTSPDSGSHTSRAKRQKVDRETRSPDFAVNPPVLEGTTGDRNEVCTFPDSRSVGEPSEHPCENFDADRDAVLDKTYSPASNPETDDASTDSQISRREENGGKYRHRKQVTSTKKSKGKHSVDENKMNHRTHESSEGQQSVLVSSPSKLHGVQVMETEEEMRGEPLDRKALGERHKKGKRRSHQQKQNPDSCKHLSAIEIETQQPETGESQSTETVSEMGEVRSKGKKLLRQAKKQGKKSLSAVLCSGYPGHVEQTEQTAAESEYADFRLPLDSAQHTHFELKSLLKKKKRKSVVVFKKSVRFHGLKSRDNGGCADSEQSDSCSPEVATESGSDDYNEEIQSQSSSPIESSALVADGEPHDISEARRCKQASTECSELDPAENGQTFQTVEATEGILVGFTAEKPSKQGKKGKGSKKKTLSLKDVQNFPQLNTEALRESMSDSDLRENHVGGVVSASTSDSGDTVEEDGFAQLADPASPKLLHGHKHKTRRPLGDVSATDSSVTSVKAVGKKFRKCKRRDADIQVETENVESLQGLEDFLVSPADAVKTKQHFYVTTIRRHLGFDSVRAAVTTVLCSSGFKMFAGSFPRVLRSVIPPKIRNFSTPPSKVTPTGKFPGVKMPVLSSRCEQLRAADLIDYQAVMAIDPDIHSGLDQLPYDYPSFVTGPGIRGYIYTMGLAGRFSPDCRAEGMYARFARSMLQGYQGLPELRYNTQTIADYGTLVARPRKWLQGGRKVLDKLGKVWDIDRKALENSQSPIQLPVTCVVRDLSNWEVFTMLSRDHEDVCHLFPEGRLLGNPQGSPCRLMPDNLKTIFKENNAFLASGETSPPTTSGSKFPGTLVTYSSFYYCDRGLCYTIDIYGTGCAEELRAHLQWHLARALSVSDATGTVLLITYQPKMSESIEEMAEAIPLLGSSDSHFTVVETPFPHMV